VVRCGGRDHVVVWRRGSLVPAHHDDLQAEEMLVALGADRPACMDVVRGWRAAMIEPAHPPWMTFFRLTPTAPPVAFMERREVQVLPESLRRMRTLTVVGRWQPNEACDTMLLDRAHAALRSSSLRRHSVEAITGAGPPTLARRRNRPVVVLQFRWLTNVWARQLEVVNGNFAIDAATRPGPDGKIAVRVVRWGDDGPFVDDIRVEV
jgi:hypothetical protein